MKVLQICHKPPFPPIDGGCKAMHQVSEILLDSGAELHVLAIETFKHPVNDSLQPAAYRKKTNFDSVFVDIKVRPFSAFLNLFSKASYNISRFWNADFANKIIEKLKLGDFDSIQLESLYVAPYLPLIRKYSNAKIVYRAHNLEHKIWETNLKITASPFKKAYIQLLLKRLKAFETEFVKKLDHIVAISPVDAHWIQAHSTVPVHVIPFGMTSPEPSDTVKKDICYLGALDWYPNQLGLEWFLKNVWADIHAEFPNQKLNIAGRGAPKSILEWNYPSLKIIGEVADANSFLSQHAIMLVPLFAGSGIRIKILEALAHKQAIVSTSLGAEGLDLENGKHILLANSATEFKQVLSALLKNEALQNSISKNGFDRFTELYSLATVRDKWLNFYQSIF